LLEGKNVNLRIVEKEDIPLLNEWANSLEIGGEYEFSRQVSRTEMEKSFEKSISEPSTVEWKTFMIEKKDKTKIGYVVHFNTLHPAGKIQEIGYVMTPKERRKGYCTEAVRMILDYLFLSKDLACIQAMVDVRNVASQKVLEKAGFRKEGIIRKRFFIRGIWTDNAVYSILREEWKEPKILTRTEMKWKDCVCY
jgi:ribosomal-protein-alanine N-acetyltransferase